EVSDAFSDRLLGPLLPEIPALQIKLICLRILCVALGEPFLLLVGKPAAQLRRDLAGHLLLHRLDLRELSPKLAAPEVGVVPPLPEFRIREENFVALNKLSFENSLDLQLPSRRLSTHVPSSVAANRVAGHHFEIG